jgi:hypothetical protein
LFCYKTNLPFLSIIISFPCRNQNIRPLIHPNTKNNYKKTKWVHWKLKF